MSVSGVRARSPRAAVGRADLLRVAARLSPEGLAAAAAALGFRERLPEPEAPRAAPATPMDPLPRVDVPVPDREPERFWRMEEMTFFDEAPPVSPPEEPAPPLTDDDLHGPGSLFAVPRAPPLAPWRKLWPAVREALHGCVPGRDPDVPALVRAWGRGEVVSRLPRVLRRTWAARAALWLDRSPRLVPFWSDQLDVWRRIRAACGRSAIEVRWLDARTQAHAVRRGGDMTAGRLAPETPVLVLGDLGTYGSDADRAAWQATARRLASAGVRAAALLPAPPARWAPPVARQWSAFSWEDGRRGAARSARPGDDTWQQRAARLLRLVSPAALVQPGLLRVLRLLLPARESDAATEADAWAHRDVRAADVSGLVLLSDAAKRLREQFETNETSALKQAVSDAIGLWHGKLPRQLLRAETLAWLDEAAPPGDRQDALDYVARMVTSARGEMASAARMLARKMLVSMPDAVYGKIPGLDVVWVSAFGGTGMREPEGVDAARLAAALKPGVPRWWAVRQVGACLELAPSPGPAWPSHVDGPGSPVAWLLAAGPLLRIGDRSTPLEAGPLPVKAGEGVKLRTDRCEVTVGVWEKEAWAVAAGRDRFGLWADFEAKGVVQRFRWIPPGRCVMGSTKGEAGRHDDEGPQHVVTLTRGWWLADTPMTQALWVALGERNPSRFVSAERPVERVSWDDCQGFVAQVNALVPELDARLPSEVEWEYACRAGMETETWRGDLDMRGENDAPLLDAIAWYGGNSGQGFELANGHDSSAWPEQQYPHTRAGTRPVRGKQPNPFGLYEMLGNVYEWCVDTWGDYADDAVEHPVSATGSFRVLRGGCWNSPALHVRAAFRNADSATYRGDDQGFRLARGQGPGPGAEPRTRSGPENHVPGRGPSQAPKLRSPKELVEPGRAVTLDATLTALLSPRERHVVELMLSGSSRKEIAARLDVSDETVKTYLTRAYRMLRVSGRAGLLKLTDGGRQS